MRPLALALLILWASASPAQAQEIYHWVDSHGEEHFGTNPPPGVRAEIWEPDAEPRVIIRPGTSDRQSETGHRPSRAPHSRLTRPTAPRQSAEDPKYIAGKSEHQWRQSGVRLSNRVENVEEQLEDARWATAPAHYSSLSSARWDARQAARIERLEKDLERAEQALEDLEDQARQAGVPPGWLR